MILFASRRIFVKRTQVRSCCLSVLTPQVSFRASNAASTFGGMKKEAGGRLMLTLGTLFAASFALLPALFQLVTVKSNAATSFLGTSATTLFAAAMLVLDFYTE